MSNPTISIIVPVYNVEQYLHQCLDSILAQSFTNWECILVDDGSIDNSGEICDEYAKKDSRFEVIHKKNEGVAIARITAFERSRAELITFVDADDYIDNNYIIHLYSCIVNHNVDFSCCQFETVMNDNLIKVERTSFGYFDRVAIENLLRTNFLYSHQLGMSEIPLYLWGKMIKRTFVENILNAGLGLWYGEDMVAIINLAQQVSTMFVSNESHYYYVIHEGQATKKTDKIRWDANVRLWNRIDEVDVMQWFKDQLPNRMIVHLLKFLSESVEQKSYRMFREDWIYVIYTKIIQDKILSYKFDLKNTNIRYQLWLIQHNKPFLFYICKKLVHYKNNI